MNLSFGGEAAFLPMWIVFLLWVAVDCVVAMGIWRDATRILESKSDLRFLTPGGWGFVALVGGLAVLVIYWLIHYSSFRGETYLEVRPTETDGEN